MKKLSFFLIFIFIISCGAKITKKQKENLKIIRTWIKQKKYKKSETALLKFLKDEPNHLEAISLLSRVYFLQKNFKNSLKNFKKLIDLGEKKAKNFLRVADSHKNLNQTFSAMKNYKKAIKIDPLLTSAYLKIGDIFLEWKNVKKASLWYKKAIKIEKKVADTFYSLAKLQYSMNEYQTTLSYLKKTFEVNPAHLDGRLLELTILQALDRKKELAQKIIVLINTFPKNPKGYYFLARFFLDIKKYDKSLPFYQKTLELAPEAAYAYKGMGNYYYKTKEYQKSLEFYKKALKFNENYSDVYFNMGLVFWDMKNYKDSSSHFKKAFDLDKSLKQAILFYSLSQYNLNQYKNSVNQLIKYQINDLRKYSRSFQSEKFKNDMKKVVGKFWDFYKPSNPQHEGLFLLLNNKQSQAINQFQNITKTTLSYYHLARLYALKGNAFEAKKWFLLYFKNDKKSKVVSKETILQETSFNELKKEDWFLKLLEEGS